MTSWLSDWANLLLRWAHFIAGIAWIGSSFYFIWLDRALTKPEREEPGVEGDLWMVHSGGGFWVGKRRPGPGGGAAALDWVQWEAKRPWVAGDRVPGVGFYPRGALPPRRTGQAAVRAQQLHDVPGAVHHAVESFSSDVREPRQLARAAAPLPRRRRRAPRDDRAGLVATLGVGPCRTGARWGHVLLDAQPQSGSAHSDGAGRFSSALPRRPRGHRPAFPTLPFPISKRPDGWTCAGRRLVRYPGEYRAHGGAHPRAGGRHEDDAAREQDRHHAGRARSPRTVDRRRRATALVLHGRQEPRRPARLGCLLIGVRQLQQRSLTIRPPDERHPHR